MKNTPSGECHRLLHGGIYGSCLRTRQKRRTPSKAALHHLKKETDMIGKIRTFRELFEMELRYAYDCEQKLVKKGLPAMIEAASSPELRSGLQQHLEETRGHVARLERVFSSLGVEPETKSNGVLDELTKA